MKRKHIADLELWEKSGTRPLPPPPAPGSLGDWMPFILLMALYALIYFAPWTH